MHRQVGRRVGICGFAALAAFISTTCLAQDKPAPAADKTATRRKNGGQDHPGL